VPRRIREGGTQPLLLDTHAWVWLVDGAEGRLARRVVDDIRRASWERRLFVSPLSVWEVATLVRKRRLALREELRDWVEQAFVRTAAQVAEFTVAVALDAVTLPGAPGADPADRILIATARALGATLITRDSEILAYGRGGHVRVRDAGG
jgi:PIN domain nuclease of toxin-antitoxin system